MINESNWNIWKTAFDNLNLRDHGDNLEIMGFEKYNLKELFPNYELFWRYHIAPATNRPANLKFRKNTNAVITHMSQLNNNILLDIVRSSVNLEKIKGADFGEIRYENSFNAMKQIGDSIQKFTDIQNHIEKELMKNVLNKNEKIWSKNDWKEIWKPKREKVIKFRNFLTHTGQLEVILSKDNHIPYVLNKEAFFTLSPNNEDISWELQQKIYKESPEKYENLITVTENIYKDSIMWLNDAYGEIIKLLQPYLIEEHYHHLWGWDTKEFGIFNNEDGIVGAQYS